MSFKSWSYLLSARLWLQTFRFEPIIDFEMIISSKVCKIRKLSDDEINIAVLNQESLVLSKKIATKKSRKLIFEFSYIHIGEFTGYIRLANLSRLAKLTKKKIID